MPEISVIVPVYKAEHFLKDCVDSILSQSFQDFEVILVEDGSPDDSGRICDEYAARYSNISVIHQENRGQAAARNHAMTQAKGNWICFVDSDDLIHPNMLVLLYQAVQENSVPISMCGMLEAMDLPDDFVAERKVTFQSLTLDEDTLTVLYDADQYPGWVACAKLIRRDIIEAYPFHVGRVYEDNEAVCRWICNGGSIAITQENLYFYRGNPDSTTKAAFHIKRLDYLWALESIISFYSQLQYEKMRQRFADRYMNAVLDCCNGARYLLGRPDVVKQIEKQTKAFLRKEKIRLTKPQFEAMLDAMHPDLVKLYWPVNGALNTLRQEGVAGIFRKIGKRFGRGEGQ